MSRIPIFLVIYYLHTLHERMIWFVMMHGFMKTLRTRMVRCNSILEMHFFYITTYHSSRNLNVKLASFNVLLLEVDKERV